MTILSQRLLWLANLRDDNGILSAYIKVDPRLMRDPRHPVVELKSALKVAARRITRPEWKEALSRERDRVLEFVSQWNPSGRGLAIFSCGPSRIWEVLALRVPVPNFVDVDVRPHTALLAKIVDEYSSFAVAVVQRDQAVIYLTAEQVVEEKARLQSDVPGQHDQGGWSQPRFQRHIEFHVDEHLKQVIEELKQAEPSFSRLALGGTEETTSVLLKALPDSLSRKIIGTFPVDHKHDSEEDILKRARVVWEKKEREEEEALVRGAIDAAKSGGPGALGLRQTMDLLVQQKVRTLLLPDGLEVKGVACLQCDYVGTEDVKACPICGGELEVGNITDRLVDKALTNGAEIENVRDPAAGNLAREGGIAALLRYA